MTFSSFEQIRFHGLLLNDLIGKHCRERHRPNDIFQITGFQVIQGKLHALYMGNWQGEYMPTGTRVAFNNFENFEIVVGHHNDRKDTAPDSRRSRRPRRPVSANLQRR